MKLKIFLFAACIFCFAVTGFTQKKPVVKTANYSKFKVPKMTTMLGTYADSLGLPSAEVVKVIGMPLKVVDVKQAVYSITSYQFLYKKVVVSETEDGKPIPATSVASQRFNSSPLPDIWVNTIKEQLRKGEEIYFFDIIVKDNEGHVMYAPNLKISVL